MQPLCDAMTDMVRSYDSKYLNEGEQVLVGLDGPFVSRRVTPRDLLSAFIGSIVCVEGIVTKCTLSFTISFIICCKLCFYLLIFHVLAMYSKVFKTLCVVSEIHFSFLYIYIYTL